MIIDPPPPEAERIAQIPLDSVPPKAKQGLDDFGPEPHLSLNPGAPQRKPRSTVKFVLGMVVLIVCVLGANGYFRNLWKREEEEEGLNDHMHEPEEEVSDWNEVVRPMITKNSVFDIVASVWVRDEHAKDGVMFIDEEERSERLLYSGTVFKGVKSNSKNVFANVPLRVPTSHFKKANLSNYDLRASFVLTQPDRPSWVEFATNYTTWKPEWFKTPSVRKWASKPTLEDEIYDSFGITIPLLQFHNIASRRSTHLHPGTSTVQSDEEEELVWTGDKVRNSFDLEFTGRQTVTDYHPYITTRTHLRIVSETALFRREAYDRSQEDLLSDLCIDPITDSTYEYAQWHQCSRPYILSVFETKIHLQFPPSNSESTKEAGEQGKLEWLYAPFLSAIEQASGPKDLVAIPVDREEVFEGVEPQNLTPDDEYVTVTWKLSFAGYTPKKFVEMEDALHSLPRVYNMTASQSELEYLQSSIELAIAFAGYGIDENAHPRRVSFILKTEPYLRVFSWLLTVHYWYARTSTVGIARLGTTFLALGKVLLVFQMMYVLADPGVWLMPFLLIYTALLVAPFFMLKAVLRLEFGRSSEHGKGNWTPRIHLVKATHLERASERIEGRISRWVKLLLLVAFFSAEHFLDLSSMYLLPPRVQVPAEMLAPVYSPPSFLASLRDSLYLTGSILQFIMNSHSKTYAGKYKLAAMTLALEEVLALLILMPSIAGNTRMLHGVYVSEAVVRLVPIVDLVQAVRYRSVKSLEDDVE